MVPLSAEERERVLLVEDSEDYLQAPVMEGQVAGSVKVLLDGEIIMYANLVCQKEVKERSIRRIIPEILKAIIN
jgi:hypothetical protein